MFLQLNDGKLLNLHYLDNICLDENTVKYYLINDTIITENYSSQAEASERYSNVMKTVKDGGGGYEPTGEIDISENGTYNVTEFASANVNVDLSSETSDATATAGDILDYKTAYANGKKIIGLIPVYDNGCISPFDININSYTNGTLYGSFSLGSSFGHGLHLLPSSDINVKIDDSILRDILGIKANKIKKGETICGVTGTYEGINTSDANATVNDILKNKTAYVNGVKLTGIHEDLDTSDANATASDILLGKTAYVNGVKLVGTHNDGPTPPQPVTRTIQFHEGDTVMVNWAMIIDALENQLTEAEKSKLVSTNDTCGSYTLQLAEGEDDKNNCGFFINGSDEYFPFADSSNDEIFAPDSGYWSSYTNITVQDLINSLKLTSVADRPIVLKDTIEYTLYDNNVIKLWFDDGTYKDIILPGEFIFVNSADPFEYNVVVGNNIKFNGANLASALNDQLTAEEKSKNILMDGSGIPTIVSGFYNTADNYNMYDTHNPRAGLETDSAGDSMIFSNHFAVSIEYFKGDYIAQNLINNLVDDIAPVDVDGCWVTYPNMIELVFEDETRKIIWLTEPLFEILT